MSHPRRTLTVVPATTTDLSTLAQEINDAHERFTTSLRESVVHAVDCGAKLHAANAQVAHGEWLPWLAKNVPSISPRTAQDYMRLSRDERTLQIADLGISGVLETIREPRPKARSPRICPGRTLAKPCGDSLTRRSCWQSVAARGQSRSQRTRRCANYTPWPRCRCSLPGCRTDGSRSASSPTRAVS